MSKGLPLFSRCGIMDIEENVTVMQNVDDDDACSGKTIMTCDNGGDTKPWSDLTHDVLFLVMMQLGVIDFVAFSGVCKSWRSFALCNMNTFMASRAPMFMYTNDRWEDLDNERCCYLKDVEGRRFKTVIPHSAGTLVVGLTCGYVILFHHKIHDFRLVHLITRHELHFPNPPVDIVHPASIGTIEAILVFSPSMSGGWVFLVLSIDAQEIWFSSESGTWDHVSFIAPMQDLAFCKGKIYTLDGACGFRRHVKPMIGVVTLDPKPKETKITILETKTIPSSGPAGLVCSGENLYLLLEPSFLHTGVCFTPHKLDFDEMKWVDVADEKFFLSSETSPVVVKPDSWWQSQFRISAFDDLCGNERFFVSSIMWYFPHQSTNINHIDH